MNKRTSLLIFTFLCVFSVATSQNSQLYDLFEKSEATALSAEELAAGKQIVDNAITDNSLNKQAKTWYERGRFYSLIYRSNNNLPGVKKADVLQAVYDANEKVQQLGAEFDSYKPLMNYEVQNLWNAVFNEGVAQYQKNNMTSAIKYFERSSILKPQDTLSYLYAASLAGDAQKYEVALRNYKKLVKLNPKEDYYGMIITIENSILQDQEAAMKSVQEAKAVFGNANPLINAYEIDILIALGQLEKALNQLNGAIAAQPDKEILRLKKGLLYDQLISMEKDKAAPNQNQVDKWTMEAANAYQQALALNPNSLTANYNLSVLFSQQANDLYKQANELPLEEFETKGAELERQGKELFKTALPFMEKAREIDPTDIGVLRALQLYYAKLEMDDKYVDVNNKLKELGY